MHEHEVVGVWSGYVYMPCTAYARILTISLVGCMSLHHKTAAVRYFVAMDVLGRQPGLRTARGEEGGGPGWRFGPQRCGVVE